MLRIIIPLKPVVLVRERGIEERQERVSEDFFHIEISVHDPAEYQNWGGPFSRYPGPYVDFERVPSGGLHFPWLTHFSEA